MTPGWLLLLAGGGLVAGILGAFKSPRVWLGPTLAGAVAALAAAVWMLAGGVVWDWQPDFVIGGEALHLRLDGLSAFFLVLLSILGGAGTSYASEYWTDRAHPASAPAGRAWWNGLLLSMGFVLLCANGLHFLIGWELFTVCAYFLITCERSRREARAAGIDLVNQFAGQALGSLTIGDQSWDGAALAAINQEKQVQRMIQGMASIPLAGSGSITAALPSDPQTPFWGTGHG